ncbi:MAG: hypothetical protein NHB15_13205 [Methanosarcina barkeri]|nr:hypothetical protein [Methanosarcina sp. ERenArc_MAG2]
MFKPNPNFKIEINQKTLGNFFSEKLEKVAYENGCSLCKGKNLTVYVNESTDTYVDGYAYCHDCNEKLLVHVNIDIDREVRKIENEMKKMFKR